jgi:hypothetical protein
MSVEDVIARALLTAEPDIEPLGVLGLEVYLASNGG